MPRVAAIVPAFNEEETVGNVVRTLVASKAFEEVIVVSDGSTDGTASAARAAGATLVHQLPLRAGKGKALQHGVAHTDAPVVAFFDADLKNFRPEHVTLLLGPVLTGARFMNSGYRDRGPINNRIQRFMPLIGGERAMQREVFEAIPDRYVQGFMIESALNYYCRANGLPYGGTLLPGLTMRKKYQKVGWRRAIVEYFHMYAEVAKAMIFVRLRAVEFRAHFIHEKHRGE